MKKILSTLSLGLFITCMAQAQAASDFTFTFNHLALSVKDLNVTAEFYKKVFQLPEISNRTANPNIRWISLNDGKELHLISNPEKVTLNKSVHIAFSTANLEAFVKRLTELKIPYGDWPGTANAVTTRADGIKQIYLQDPNGYWLEVNNADAATSVDQIKNEVWQLEENYWKYVKAQDLKNYLTLWDENFIGYPSNNTIGTKKSITDWITDMYKGKTGIFNYTLTRKIENVFGDIVIVLYDVTHSFSNDKEPAKTFKITHTWKKTDTGWQIIGGMGANK